MDVELQILKHLKRSPIPTVSVIDRYCDSYNDLFSDVRNYECFKYLHQGIISPIKRKSLPEIAKVVGINSAQSLLDAVALCWKPTRPRCIANSHWSVEELKQTSKELEPTNGANSNELLVTKRKNSGSNIRD